MKNIPIAIVAFSLAMVTALNVMAQPEQGKRNKNRKVVKTEKTVRVQKGRGKSAFVTTKTVKIYPRTNVKVVKQRNVNVVQTLPIGYSTVTFGGRNLYYHGGRYYNSVGNTYSVIAAPIGLRVKVLPVGHRRIFIGAVPHYYYGGVYYRQTGDEYEAVEPSVGTIVPELPTDNVEEVVIDGQTLYEYDNVLYKSIVTKRGVQYEVVGKLGD
jgi:Family of unknown function (DUF6515)